jgi:PAS domain S-box-containing protein
MTDSLSFTADLEAFGLLEDFSQADPRWVRLLQSIYQRLDDRPDPRLIVDGLPDSVLRVNTLGEILDSNETVSNMFPSVNGALSRLRNIVPAEVETRLINAVHQAVDSGMLQQLEFTLEGAHFTQQFEVRVRPLSTGDALFLIREITEQSWLQKARAFSEGYFQSLLQRLNNGVLICTPDGEIIIANYALFRMLNQRDEDLLGEYYPTLAKLIASDTDTYNALIQQYETVKAGKFFPQVTLQLSKTDLVGHIWLLVNAELEHDLDARTKQLKFTFTDVTDFRNAEIALRESEEQYVALMDRITDIIYHLDSKQEILFLNAAWPRLIGYTIEDSLGNSILDFVQPEDRTSCAAVFQGTGKTEVTDIEIRLLKAADGFCWVSLRNQQIFGPDGTQIGHYGMMIDITHRKRNEAARAALTAKARTVELLTSLLTNISHDLRTPLTIINVANFKVRRYWDQIDETHRIAALMLIDEEVRRISYILEEYSDLARLDVELTDFRTVPLALNNLVRTVVQNIQNNLSYRSHEWVIEVDPVEIFIQGHVYWLTKMIRHLVDNAAQFSPDGGQIVVGVHRRETQVILEVKDNGIGIDPSDQEHIFEPLYRADKARAMETGLVGLGLTFVHRIVEALHGEINLESSVGMGTTVRICFPIYVADSTCDPSYG